MYIYIYIYIYMYICIFIYTHIQEVIYGSTDREFHRAIFTKYSLSLSICRRMCVCVYMYIHTAYRCVYVIYPAITFHYAMYACKQISTHIWQLRSRGCRM